MNLNKVLLIGNITNTPELKYTPRGVAVLEFGFALNRHYKQGDEWKTEKCFLDISLWGKRAETCSEMLRKGSLLLVHGRLRFTRWTTQHNEKRSKLDVVAEDIQVISGKAEAEKVASAIKSGDTPPF